MCTLYRVSIYTGFQKTPHNRPTRPVRIHVESMQASSQTFRLHGLPGCVLCLQEKRLPHV